MNTDERSERRIRVYLCLSVASHGRIIPAPGGVLIQNAQKEVVGAIGISGDTGDNDEACALAAIGQMGLLATPGMKT